MPTNAISVDQLKFKANNAWNGLDEVRIVNDGSALYCKENVTTGLLMEDNQLQVVAVSWTNGVPSIGAKKGYISSDGDYHIYNSSTGTDTTSLNSLRESVNHLEYSNNNSKIALGNGDIAFYTGDGLQRWVLTGVGNVRYDIKQNASDASWTTTYYFSKTTHTHAAGDITSGTLAVARLPKLFAIKSTTSSAQNITPNNCANFTITIPSVSGYVCVAIIGFNTNHNFSLALTKVWRSSTTSAAATVWNITSATTISATVSLDFLYVANGLY